MMTDAATWLDLLVGVLSLLGAGFFLASAIGLWRLPDLYTRLHAPTKAATLGIALLASGSLVSAVRNGGGWWLEDLILIAFLFVTVPLSAQMIARSALARGVEALPSTRGVAPDDGEAPRDEEDPVRTVSSTPDDPEGPSSPPRAPR